MAHVKVANLPGSSFRPRQPSCRHAQRRRRRPSTQPSSAFAPGWIPISTPWQTARVSVPGSVQCHPSSPRRAQHTRPPERQSCRVVAESTGADRSEAKTRDPRTRRAERPRQEAGADHRQAREEKARRPATPRDRGETLPAQREFQNSPWRRVRRVRRRRRGPRRHRCRDAPAPNAWRRRTPLPPPEIQGQGPRYFREAREAGHDAAAPARLSRLQPV